MLDSFHLYCKWWKTWKTLPVVSWLKAARHYRAGQFEQAEALYKQGLSKHPHHPAQTSARLDLAYCLFKSRKLVEAEEQLRYVTTNSPKLREAHLRLARLQLWMGQTLDAAWTMRRALREITADPEMVSIFMLSVLDNGGPGYLLEEAIKSASLLSDQQCKLPLFEVAMARLAIQRGESDAGRHELIRLSNQPRAPFEAVLLLGELFLSEGRVSEARGEFMRAMSVTPDHPRVLTLMAESYLKDGDLYNPEYARQLATSACQSTSWCSPREMHILAEAYLRCNDKISALIVASKAKQAGSRLLGAYTCVKNLDKLIENLSSGTQA
jgi:predicted Zn-dependent protease